MYEAEKKKYIKRYMELYQDIPKDSQKKAEELIKRLADVLVMLDQCTEHINAEGAVTEMPQGDYSIMRENPYSKVYDAKSKIMLSIISQLDKMLPDTKTASVAKAGENLARLVAGGKPLELR